MYSSLFVIGEKKTKAFFIKEGFVGDVADYLYDEDEPRMTFKRQFEWLVAHLRAQIKMDLSLLEVDYGTFTLTFKKGFREEYFHNRLDYLKRIISEMTLEEFISPGMNSHIFEIYVENKHSFYIWDDSGYYHTIDEYVRRLEDDDKTITITQAFLYYY